jgi:phosphocarrier protein
MIEQDFVIKNKLGLHARPAAILVQKLSRFKSSIKISKNEEQVDAKSVMGVLTLAVACGETIKFIIDGEDEQEAMSVIKELIENKFYIEYE